MQPVVLVSICTDSQYVINVIDAIEAHTVHNKAHKRANCDLISRY